jgi:hypothetical protein
VSEKLPDPNAEYFCTVTFGRKAKPGETDKVYVQLDYPNLSYGGMVAIQRIMVDEAMPSLVDLGIETAQAMGEHVPGLGPSGLKLEKSPVKPG